MAFPSRFNSKCSKCSAEIVAGQYISWSRREKGKASHFDCSNPDAVPDKTAVEVPAGFAPISPAPTAGLEAMMAEILTRLKGAPATAGLVDAIPSVVPEAITAKPVLTAKPKKTHTLKDGAQWYDTLKAICEASKGEYLRILLIGPPGTGKSKTSMLLAETPYRVTMTEGMGVEDLIGMFQLIKGETVWVDGPVVRAMREGVRVLFDEIDHHATEVGSVLYAFLDDKPEIMLPTGERVEALPGYGVIATTNSNVTSLPEAIFDRFEAIMQAIAPHPDALAIFEEDSQRTAVENHFKNMSSDQWQWSGKPTLRRMRAYAKLAAFIGSLNAANCAFGSAGKEMLSVLTTSARTSTTSRKGAPSVGTDSPYDDLTALCANCGNKANAHRGDTPFACPSGASNFKRMR
jgi:hypothetical protein